jgi:hypothetical protein
MRSVSNSKAKALEGLERPEDAYKALMTGLAFAPDNEVSGWMRRVWTLRDADTVRRLVNGVSPFAGARIICKGDQGADIGSLSDVQAPSRLS